MAIAINGSAARRFLARVPTDIDEATANLDRIIKDCRRASEVFDSILVLLQRGSNLFCRPSVPMWRPQTDRLDFRLEQLPSLSREP
jgi:hypothetical protein